MKKKSEKKEMFVIFNGGLGNQLFIYCAAKKYALEKNIKEIFYFSSYGLLDNFKDISFYLKNIKINKLINNRYLSFIFVLFKFKLFNSLITDQKISIKNPLKFTLLGYFQNPKWYNPFFKKVIDEIFTKKFSKELKKIPLYDVVISFRRGDYLNLGMCLHETYYLNSMKKLKISKKEKIKVVSDDNIYALYFNKFLIQNGFSVYSDKKYFNDKSFNDFLTLIKSKKLIMSNSSFCWWAALIRTKLKLSPTNVICPKNWYPGNKNIINNLMFTHPGNPLKWKLVKSKFLN